MTRDLVVIRGEMALDVWANFKSSDNMNLTLKSHSVSAACMAATWKTVGFSSRLRHKNLRSTSELSPDLMLARMLRSPLDIKFPDICSSMIHASTKPELRWSFLIIKKLLQTEFIINFARIFPTKSWCFVAFIDCGLYPFVASFYVHHNPKGTIPQISTFRSGLHRVFEALARPPR